MYHPNFYIFTGGPGSGKTTLLQELENRTFTIVPEVARDIIKEQIQKGGTALPWLDTRTYAELMFIRSVDDYVKCSMTDTLFFFDRGIPDTLAYVELTGIMPWTELMAAGNDYLYNDTVFILPPWEDIYRIDQERKQNFKTATDIYRQIKIIYQRLGYKLVEIPPMPVFRRADFVMDILSGKPGLNDR